MTTVEHMPASIAPIAKPTSASVLDPPPYTSMKKLGRMPRSPATKVELDGIAHLVGEHAVDVARREAGILNRVTNRPASERTGRHSGPARVGRLPHADNRITATQMPGTFHNVFSRLQAFAPIFVSTIKASPADPAPAVQRKREAIRFGLPRRPISRGPLMPRLHDYSTGLCWVPTPPEIWTI